jgi:cyclase
MVMKRIIPCLDVRNGRVVKGVQFLNLQDSGDPVELATRYDAEGADELVFLDITAGIEHRDTALRMVEAVAKAVFIPFTVGGGIRRAEDADALLLAGCDKVAVNSAAVRRPELLTEIAHRFGSQCAVLAVDVWRTPEGYRVVVDAGRTWTEWKLEDWLDEAQRRGAGEVLLTSMDQDGSNGGYDLESLRIASRRLRVPLIASGGFGEARHALEAFRAGADAALVASALHTGGLTVRRLKAQLIQEGVEVRSC